MSIRASLTNDPLTYARFGFSERERGLFVQVVTLSMDGAERILLWRTGILCIRELTELLQPWCTLSNATLAMLERDRRGDPQPHQRGV